MYAVVAHFLDAHKELEHQYMFVQVNLCNTYAKYHDNNIYCT